MFVKKQEFDAMSREYADKKIKEALHVNRGNAAKARQQIIDMAFSDPKLLKELVKPHMVGIVAHAVGRVENGTKGEAEANLSSGSDDSDNDSFGMDILRTIAGGDTAQFGQENYGRPVRKQSASQAHIDAIQKMINKGKS
jgi:hypothetical protein